jgi:hypothetical protein
MRKTAIVGGLATTAGAVALLAVGVVAPAAAQSTSGFTVIVSGLDNPRDLDFAPNGRLYVAEAGHGGAPEDCVAGGPEGNICPGFTSGISVIDIAGGEAHRVVTGLASVSDVGGFAATGLDGISFLGEGTLYGIMALASDLVPEGVFPPEIEAGGKAQLGRLIKATPSGQWKPVADVGHTDFVWSADHQELAPNDFPDANPYAVLAQPGSQWVVDAGANTIDRVRPNGTVSVEAFIPNAPVGDSVPTCLDQGPDGALYIGELTAAGNDPGSARIWRFVPGDSEPTVWATGLTAVTGCGFGADGQFYAVEFSTLGLINAAPGTGQVVRVPAHSTSPTTVASGLSFPGGLAAAADGSLYVSNWSIAPADSGGGPTGQAVRVTPS